MLLAAPSPTPVRPATARMIRTWRLARLNRDTGLPMTQAEVAALYRVTARTWSRYENGGSVPGWLSDLVRRDYTPPGYYTTG